MRALLLLLLFTALTPARTVPSNSPMEGGSAPPSGPLPDPPLQCADDETCAAPNNKLYCVDDTSRNDAHDRLGNLFCFPDSPSADADGDDATAHVQPRLEPYQIAPILDRRSEISARRAFAAGLPPGLVSALLSLCEALGAAELLRAGGEDGGRFATLKNGERWYAPGPASDRKGDARRIFPADESAHEDFLRGLLSLPEFGRVLEAIGTALRLDGLAAYRLEFEGASRDEGGCVGGDARSANGGAYELTIPLLLEGEGGGSILASDRNERGGYGYVVGEGILMGDGAMRGQKECDYRNSTRPKHGGEVDGKRVGMRMAATIYIADINEDNAENIARETLTQIFPPESKEWLLSQSGRHWRRDRDALAHGDPGRRAFRFRDELIDCYERMERGMCESDVEETRRWCLKTCGVYIEEGPDTASRAEGGAVEVCAVNRTGVEECKSYVDTEVPGDFVTPDLEAGELFPVLWRDTATFATEYAFQIGLPPELVSSLLSYCDALGITSLFRELVGDRPLPPEEEHTGRFAELGGNSWYIQRPAKKWTSNMHWVSPADEKTHEEYLRVLAEGNFDLVLDAIGRYLGLEGLVAYHLTFIGVSYSEKGYIHHDSTNTGASVYNVIIPLILEEDSGPELAMVDHEDGRRAGSMKYKIGMGALMGDDAMHGTEACDYREKKGMRLAATVYIADINRENAYDIARQTLTQIYPLPDTKWLLSQAGRHWGNDNDNSLKHDKGRKQFLFRDRVMDCQDLAEKGMCEAAGWTEKSKRTRQKCMKTCRVYDEALNVKSHTGEVEEGRSKFDVFFGELGDDPSCVDESSDCPHLASLGTCMSDPTAMKERGCHWSCMYCLTSDSKSIFTLGEDQTFDENGRDPESLPSQEEISAVVAETEEYFVNEVLVFDEYEHVRRSCRNNLRECSLWAAEGECDKNDGWMAKNCPAACKDCLMVDPNKRCPVDYESSVFGPGSIDKMFERWLEEAGEDVSAFSQENLPRGGSHPLGKLTVLTSPYHDMMPLLSDEDKQFAHEFSPLPWVIAIDDFLSEEECQRLIELGGEQYVRSMEDARTNAAGSDDEVVSERRTSTNAWCQDECREDPIAQGVIERMINMTGIPDGNFEHLQLVRYTSGQYYKRHHDFAPAHTGTQYGPRILTFFLYLNDEGVEGGSTSFSELDFAVQPKRGSALVWPSVINANPEEQDEWTWHEALPVVAGEKYGANAWIHLRDYQNVPDYC